MAAQLVDATILPCEEEIISQQKAEQLFRQTKSAQMMMMMMMRVLGVQRSSSWNATAAEKPAAEEPTLIKWHLSQNGKKDEKKKK